MFIRNAWYASAWGHELRADNMVSRKILGETLLFYRTSTGDVTVMRDRCSHRFAPLSIGRREGDHVRCMYHGLMFNAGGECIEEPGRKGVSPNTNIRRYPSVERYKLVWVWMGDPALANPELVPDCHFQDDPAWASDPRYIHYEADYRLILDNLLDFSHLTFVHEKTLGGSKKIAEIKPKVETTPEGVKLTRWYLDEPNVAPYLDGFATFEGPVDRWHIYKLSTLGNVFVMDSGSSPAGSGAPDGIRVPEAMQFVATQIATPEDEKHTHFFWSYAHNFRINDPEFTRMLTDRILEGFKEDKFFIEKQQAVIDEGGEEGMAFILADNGLTLGRRLIEQKLAEEAAG
jgi:phenylpropionate dioxygenase-like ring-hydroxylating dioxygenase large terminal subunit